MKNTIILLLIFLSFASSSCGSDDGPNESEQGTWQLTNRSEVEDDGIVLECEKQTVYTFSGSTVSATVFDPNEDETDCAAVESNTLSYRIDENNFLIFLDPDGNVIDTGINIEVDVFENEMRLIFRDPNEAPTSAFKTETFERQ